MAFNKQELNISYTDEDMHEKMLFLGEQFLLKKLTPIYYVDEKSNTTFILRFEKAEHGLH